MRRIAIASLFVIACDVSPDKSIGNELVSPTGGSESTTNDGNSGNIPNGNDDGMGGTSEWIDVELGAASAVLLADGLCPYPFDQSPGITLRFTNAVDICTADLVNSRPEAEIGYVELYIPSAEVGSYDAMETTIGAIHRTVEPTGGGGGSGPTLYSGIIDITEIDAGFVRGTISGTQVFGSNWVNHDINGPFEAVRCSADQWLEVFEDPRVHEPEAGFDPACTLPEPQ